MGGGGGGMFCPKRIPKIKIHLMDPKNPSYKTDLFGTVWQRKPHFITELYSLIYVFAAILKRFYSYLITE